MNVAGASAFAPPVLAGRRAFHFPEAAAVYLWVLSSWIVAFGLAYAYQAWTRRANRTVLLLAAWGKVTFAGAAATPDLVCAIR